MHRRGLLSVHGHALPGQCAAEEGQIQDQSGARVYTEFQNSPGWLQKDECGQGKGEQVSSPPPANYDLNRFKDKLMCGEGLYS